MQKDTFKFIRLYSAKSQQEFADYIGIGRTTVSSIESGHRRVTANIKAKLASKFPLDDAFFSQLEKYRKLSQN